MRSYVPFYSSLLPTPFLPFRAAERLFLIDVSIITQPHPVVKNQLLQFRTSAPSPCLFHHFAKCISPLFVRCDKIAFFARTKELFSKKLLYFSVKSVILYPTEASVGYKAKRRAFLSGTPVVHPSIIMLFSSFTFLSFTLS